MKNTEKMALVNNTEKKSRIATDPFTKERFKRSECEHISGFGCSVDVPASPCVISLKNVQNTTQERHFKVSNKKKMEYFKKHSSVWQFCEWEETGLESPVRYRLVLTIKAKNEQDKVNALAMLTTRFRFSFIGMNKGNLLVFRSCRYSKLHGFALYDIAKYFEIADFAITCHDLNDSFAGNVTDKFIKDDIKKIQKNRAKYMKLAPLYSQVKDRVIKKGKRTKEFTETVNKVNKIH